MPLIVNLELGTSLLKMKFLIPGGKEGGREGSRQESQGGGCRSGPEVSQAPRCSFSIEFEQRNDTSGTGFQFPDSGEQGGCRRRQIWAGGQPGPEMVIIQ